MDWTWHVLLDVGLGLRPDWGMVCSLVMALCSGAQKFELTVHKGTASQRHGCTTLEDVEGNWERVVYIYIYMANTIGDLPMAWAKVKYSRGFIYIFILY